MSDTESNSSAAAQEEDAAVQGTDAAAEESTAAERPVKRPSAAYYEESRQALAAGNNPGWEFLESIGLDPELAAQAGIGFDPDWSSMWTKTPGPHLVIPLWHNKYQVYNLSDGVKRPWGFFSRQRAWNMGAMFDPGIHFITSGVFDALAVMENGWEAAAILGGYNDQLFLDKLSERQWEPRPDSAYIVALGNTNGEKEVEEWLTQQLKEKGAVVCTADISGDQLRAYEAYRENPEQFSAALDEAVANACRLLAESGFDVPDEYRQPAEGMPPLSETYPPKIMCVLPRTGTHTAERCNLPISRRRYRAETQKMLLEADESVRERIERHGLPIDVLAKAGLGYDPSLAEESGADYVPILVPLADHRSVVLAWGDDGIAMQIPPVAQIAWQTPQLQQKGTVFITRDVPDALVAMANGQRAVAVLGDAAPLIDHIKRTSKWLSHDAIFVIAMGGTEEDTRIADELLKTFKAQGLLATRAAIRGDSVSLLEENKRDPEIVRKRFAVAAQKCAAVLESRAKQKTANRGRKPGKGRPQARGRAHGGPAGRAPGRKPAGRAPGSRPAGAQGQRPAGSGRPSRPQ